MPETTVWNDVLSRIRLRLEPEDFRHWFGSTSYASDAGDQITVWVPSEAIRRHIATHYQREVDDAVQAVGRAGTHIRFVVAGFDDEEEEKET